MVDTVNSQTRSRMMSGIRSKDTRPELALRTALHAAGFRYRLHGKGMPGKPDLVMPMHRAVIFVHGCFWHRHADCRFTTTPATRPEFWQAKFEANVARDRVVHADLLRAGWRVATVWECALRTETGIAAARDTLAAWLKDDRGEIEIGEEGTRPAKGA